MREELAFIDFEFKRAIEVLAVRIHPNPTNQINHVGIPSREHAVAAAKALIDYYNIKQEELYPQPYEGKVMKTFWCSNLKVGDVVVICTFGDTYKYTGEVVSNEKHQHPVIRCRANEKLSGTYTFRRGFKWGSTKIYIEILD